MLFTTLEVIKFSFLFLTFGLVLGYVLAQPNVRDWFFEPIEKDDNENNNEN